MTFITIINFKTYKEATGSDAIALAKACERVAKKSGKTIWIAVAALDLAAVAKAVSIPVLAQHIDDAPAGGHTGSINAEACKKAGAYGTLINHSENPLALNEIGKRVEAAKAAKLKTVVCAKDAAAAKKILAFKPDFIAIEPPALIGGTISVAEAQPELIRKGYAVVKGSSTKLIVGAGVHSYQDVVTSRAHGAMGILVASGVVKAKDPGKVISELVA